jgi:hypothetical protein
MAPTFQFEENRLVYSLRLLAYPGDNFTSEQSCRCAFVVFAARAGERTPGTYETDVAEWNRVLDLLLAAEPSTWVQNRWVARAKEGRRLVNER